ncbi:hypothetical protein phiV141_35 [Vibrio phage phiV141]|uniref:Tail tubular protein B n=1 Tax=Vibrio phage phiV141 TaxID=2723905 RepID=A0A7D7IS66_9CAUD|nr:hypothetical protein phiV141_35 [Vibrio phage phiV141]
MSFDSPLPPPTFGVATVPAVTRPEGFCEQQVNWRNDQQEKLTVRPKFRHLDEVLPEWSDGTPDTIKRHTSFRDGVRQEVVVGVTAATKLVEVFQRTGHGVFTYVSRGVNDDWLGDGLDIGINDIDEVFYIWNKEATMSTYTNLPISPVKWKQAASVNVTSALNYSEGVVVTAYLDGVEIGEATHTVPGVTSGDTSVADTQRATNYVAEQIATKLDMIVDVTAQFKGSNVHVKWTGLDDTKELTLAVSSGRGEGAVVVHNYEITNITSLPKYADVGQIHKVAPDPTSDKGVYYLEATEVAAFTGELSEVVWTECASPVDGTTQFLSYVLVLDNGVLTQVNFKERQVGDDDSNPPLDFANRKIQQIESFQDRLVILAGSKMNISKTKDYEQFWLNSAVGLLVTDPTDVGTSGNNSTLRHTVFHNRDLLIFAEDAQFKVDGTTAITPQTAAMPITTANECNLDVAPVLLGSNVYYANNYGGSGGIRRFEVEADTVVDSSVSITDHIVGYLKGAVTELVSNANQNMLVCRSSQCSPNEFFVFEQQFYGESPIYSWCSWKLREGVVINGIDLFNEVLTVWYDDKHYMSCDLKSGEVYPLRDVCLDQFGEATLTGLELRLPESYQYNGEEAFTILLADETDVAVLAMLEYEYVWDAINSEHVFTINSSWDANKDVYYGFQYEALYEPTRPYERDRDGNVRTTDRLRIAHYFLELSNTYRLTRRIIADWWDIPDEDFTSLTGNSEFISEVKPFTGQWRPQIGMNAADCRVQFINKSPYSATIASISHRSQLYSTKTRR